MPGMWRGPPHDGRENDLTLHDAEIAQDIGVKCLLYSGGHNSKLLLRESRFPIINTLSEVLPFLIS